MGDAVVRRVNWKAFALLGIGIALLGIGAFALSASSGKPSAGVTSVSKPVALVNNSPIDSTVGPATADNWGLEPLDSAISAVSEKRGVRFQVPENASTPILEHLVKQIPLSQFADLISLYKTIKGLDGTTTEEGAVRLRSLYIGKYYILPFNTFDIRADRDYPQEGLNEFSMFGEVNLVGNMYVPVNLECVSLQKIPPYSKTIMLTKITGFNIGESRDGSKIIIPEVRIVALIKPSGCCDYPEAVIINRY